MGTQSHYAYTSNSTVIAILLIYLCRVSLLARLLTVRMVCKDLLIEPALPMMNACTLTACQPYASKLFVLD